MLRGKEVSRIEGFSDAVFGFTLTLLVVSVEVPNDFADLRTLLFGVPAFAVTFTVICWIWYEHYLFFRRYALEDNFTVLLNCILLFIVMLYAYPLKFMFTRLITGSLLGLGPRISDAMTSGNARMLMVMYSGGFVALFGTFMLMQWNAWRQRTAIGLDALQAYDARSSVRRHGISVAIGALSIAIAVALPADYLGLAGLIYFLMGPAHGFYGYIYGRRRERLEASLCQQASGTLPPGTASADASNA